jgi:hypothetical protein
MAMRPDTSVDVLFISPTEVGYSGGIKLADMEESVYVEMSGSILSRKLANGFILYGRGEHDGRKFGAEQVGKFGDVVYHEATNGNPATVYIEWYSQESGRVVIEACVTEDAPTAEGTLVLRQESAQQEFNRKARARIEVLRKAIPETKASLRSMRNELTELENITPAT